MIEQSNLPVFLNSEIKETRGRKSVENAAVNLGGSRSHFTGYFQTSIL